MWRTTLLVTLAVIVSAAHVAAGISHVLSFCLVSLLGLWALHTDSHSPADCSVTGASDRAAVSTRKFKSRCAAYAAIPPIQCTACILSPQCDGLLGSSHTLLSLSLPFNPAAGPVLFVPVCRCALFNIQMGDLSAVLTIIYGCRPHIWDRILGFGILLVHSI